MLFFCTLLLWEIKNWSSTRGNEASYRALGRSSIFLPPYITNPYPTYGASRLCHIPILSPAAQAVSSIMLPTRVSCYFLLQLPLSAASITHMPFTFSFALPIRCEIYISLPDCFLSSAFLRPHLCSWDYNFTEMLIIFPPAGLPLALQVVPQQHDGSSLFLFILLLQPYWATKHE